MDDVVANWTLKIAERVAPNEVDFADEVGQAYAAGGRDRAALFPRPGAEPGGFGLTALIGELPVILRALADSVESLRSLLGAPELGNIVALVGLAIAARSGKSDNRKPDDGNDPDPEQDGSVRNGETSIPGNSDTQHGIDSDITPETDSALETAALESAFRQLRDRLDHDGMTHLRAELVAYELLAVLLSDPDDGQEFLRGLTDEPQ